MVAAALERRWALCALFLAGACGGLEPHPPIAYERAPFVPDDIVDAAVPPSSFADSGSGSVTPMSADASSSEPPKKPPSKPKDDLCYKKLANGCCSEVSQKPKAGKCPKGYTAASACKISDKCKAPDG
jgi:hypothetical protein